jgi:hypothetical protein
MKRKRKEREERISKPWKKKKRRKETKKEIKVLERGFRCICVGMKGLFKWRTLTRVK